MLGVVAEQRDMEIAAEFFELFKTPWEPAVPGRSYRVVLNSSERAHGVDAKVMLMYGSTERSIDVQAGVTALRTSSPTDVAFETDRLPLYKGARFFEGRRDGGFLRSPHGSLTYRHESNDGTAWRIGYDLFEEAGELLRKGQPAANAQVPTLELHIAALRRLLVESEVPFVEVLPRPLGYDFTCCLTHDLDFVGIRRHGLDRTVGGFLARASLGTLVDWLRRERPTSEAIENWRAVAALPFVFLNVARDFWHPVEDYERADGQRSSTYFVVPFKNRPGVSPGGTVNVARAVKYEARDVENDLRTAAAHGRELALHGIDAWRDSQAGCAEKGQVIALTGQQSVGVRMHWLYFAEHSPAELEKAGFAYDSTWGYNDAVGYRAGTSQVFRLPGTRDLMELPLAVMDTALFFRGRMGLQRDDALQRCIRIVANMDRFGGTLVVNWHDRSLAPERLWGATYGALLEALSAGRSVWFATATQAVDWYRWRRSIRFTSDSSCRVTVRADRHGSTLPGARLALYRVAKGGTRSVDHVRYVGDQSMTVDL
jgi:hypothetical protein